MISGLSGKEMMDSTNSCHRSLHTATIAAFEGIQVKMINPYTCRKMRTRDAEV